MDLFNIRFSGDYDLLKWIIKKYKNALPYNGEVLRFSASLPYCKSMCHDWNHYGVPTRVWNSLHKDLVIARLMGKIKDEDVRTLEQLRQEFKNEVMK